MSVYFHAALLHVLVLTLCILVPEIKCYLWFEDIPPVEDKECTLIMTGLPMLSELDDVRYYHDFHPPTTCRKGGFIWYAANATVHLHYYISPEKDKDFLVCLDSGLPHTITIWWDTTGGYWQNYNFPDYMGHVLTRNRCKPSKNGVLDAYVNVQRFNFYYVTWLAWSIHPMDNPEDKEFPEDAEYEELMADLGEPGYEHIKDKAVEYV